MDKATGRSIHAQHNVQINVQSRSCNGVPSSFWVLARFEGVHPTLHEGICKKNLPKEGRTLRQCFVAFAPRRVVIFLRVTESQGGRNSRKTVLLTVMVLYSLG